jgi:hypothetical protein
MCKCGEVTVNCALCKDCRRAYRQSRPFHNMVQTARSADKRKGFIVKKPIRVEKLDIEYKLQDFECFYCYCVLLYGNDIDRRKNPDSITIERISNHIGHEFDNCVLACLGCNNIRGNRSFDTMVMYGKKLKSGLFGFCKDCEDCLEIHKFTRTNNTICKICKIKRNRIIEMNRIYTPDERIIRLRNQAIRRQRLTPEQKAKINNNAKIYMRLNRKRAKIAADLVQNEANLTKYLVPK